MRSRPGSWKNRGFEFLSIFIAVVSAFALNNWNENRRDAKSENKILIEIANGLEKDLNDIQSNKNGHQTGIEACNYIRNAMTDQDVDRDSLLNYYFQLTRDYISVQNIAGYETLKSKGMELISNDSLRLQIISLYEYDYNTLRKLEEEYYEMQFQANYFKEINRFIAPNFQFDSKENIMGINLPLVVAPTDKKILLLYLLKIQSNRHFILKHYSEIENRINEVHDHIEHELNN